MLGTGGGLRIGGLIGPRPKRDTGDEQALARLRLGGRIKVTSAGSTCVALDGDDPARPGGRASAARAWKPVRNWQIDGKSGVCRNCKARARRRRPRGLRLSAVLDQAGVG